MPQECFERTGLMTKTTMIIDGEVVGGFVKNMPRIQELVKKLQVHGYGGGGDDR